MVLPTLPLDIVLLVLEYLPVPSCSPSKSIRNDSQEHQGSKQNALYCCSVANRELSQVAGRVLYRSIGLSFSKKVALESSWTDWKGELAFHNDEADVDEYGLPVAPHPLLSALSSKSLNPTYTYVQHLYITGYLSTLPPGPSNRLPALLSEAIRLFTCGAQAKLQSLHLTPEVCHPQTFVQSLKVLSELAELESGSSQCLCELHLNQHAFDDEDKTKLLAQVRGLKRITLENPTRVLLQALAGTREKGDNISHLGWLCYLQTDLIELHLKNNCGSITPGVLNSFIPYLSDLQCLTLGISYSLTDKDVFVALSQLKKLKCVDLRWYLQLNSPPSTVFVEEWPLPSLEILKVGYSSRSLQAMFPRANVRNHHRFHTHTRLCSEPTEVDELSLSDGSNDTRDADYECPLCSWVVKVTAGSPALKEVVFIDEDQDEDDDEISNIDDAEEGDDVEPVEAVTDRVMWMMRENLNLNLGESIVEEEEEGEEEEG